MNMDVGGQIKGISLDSFLQMVQMEKGTCTLYVTTGPQTGVLYMLKGELVAAETGELLNLDAALEILGWDKTIISIENTCEKKTNEINQPLMNLLMEGMRRKDENKERQKELEYLSETMVPPDLADIIEPVTAKAPAEKSPPAVEPPTAEAEEVEVPPLPTPDDDSFSAVGPKKSFWPMPGVLIITGVILVLAAGLWMWRSFSTPGEDVIFQRTMTRVASVGSMAEKQRMIEKYIAENPQSPFLAEARNRIQEIEKIQAQSALDVSITQVNALPVDNKYMSSATAILEKFIRQYGKGHPALAQKARDRIDGLEHVVENRDFDKALKTSGAISERLGALQRYLSIYPDGRHLKKARERMQVLGEDYFKKIQQSISDCEQSRQWDACIKECTQFLKMLKGHPRSKQVQNLRAGLQDQIEFRKLRQRAEEKLPDVEAARRVYADYLVGHPNFTQRLPVEKLMASLDKDVAKLQAWRAIRKKAGEPKTDIFKRVQQLGAYIDENPKGPYINEAEDLMAQLQQARTAELRRLQAQKKQQAAEAKNRQQQQRRQQEAARIQSATDRMARKMTSVSDRFAVQQNGTVTDQRTGLTWVLLDSSAVLQKCISHENAQRYVKGLTTGGYRDWRLPTAAELAAIYKNPPFFPSGEAPWLWSSETYVKGYHKMGYTVTTKAERVFKKKSTNLKECGAVQAVRR